MLQAAGTTSHPTPHSGHPASLAHLSITFCLLFVPSHTAQPVGLGCLGRLISHLTALFTLDVSNKLSRRLERSSKISESARERRVPGTVSLSFLSSWSLGSGAALKLSASAPSCRPGVLCQRPVPQLSATPPKPELSCLLSGYKLISCHQ